MVSLTINGKQVTASPEKTILQVCREQKIDNIPTLCFDEKLPAFGSCFLCVVELEGQSRLFPSCATKVAEGMKIQTRSEKVKRARKTCLELLLSDHYADCFGPCRLNCPADVDIQGYMSLIHLGKFKEAVALVKEKNPLPSVCGRVCTRKCEINCRRSIVDTPVGIDFLKRYAADQDMIGEMWKPNVKAANGERVAIVGSGPAGLACAYYLVVEGYRPTIFESLPDLGGMLRYGIPEYRLPKDVLDKEINWILDLGVDVRTNKTLGKDFTIDDLFSQGYKSVFVALGAQVGKPMQVENEEAAGVLSGVEFLRQVQLRTNPKIYGRVVVVGGGNTAIDAARTSLRLGAKEVILLYRRTRNEIPANKMEVDAAEHEGVKMEFLSAPVRVNVENDRLTTISCIRMQLGEPDASGRRRPVEVKGSDYTLPCDWVISAIGQEADLGGVTEDTAIKVTKWKTIVAKNGTFDTDRPGVFAGGDVVTGPADAIDAIAAGRMAARAIDKYVKDGIVEPVVNRFESRRDNFHKIAATDLPQIQQSERQGMPELSPMERILGFNEVELGYDRERAIAESLRCAECGCDVGLSCQLQDYCTEYGVDQKRFAGAFSRYTVDVRHPYIKIDLNKCIRCGRCVNTCAEILNIAALGFVNRGFRTIVKPAMEKPLSETNCVSCGNCIDVCPTGALVEKMPFRKSGPWSMTPFYSVCNYCSVGCIVSVQVKTPDLFYVVGAPPDAKPNHGELCVRGRFGYEHYLDGSRQTQPMVRREGGLVPATWEEALAEVQKGLSRVLTDHSPDHIMVSASPKLTNEELYLAGRFARAGVKTNNIASFHQLVNEADYHALDDMFGGTYSTVGDEEIQNADLYLIVGGNPTVETPVLGWTIKRRIRKGTPAIVINSGEIDLTAYATVWADARRGTITLLLNGVMAELVRRGLVSREYIDQRTTNFRQIANTIGKYDLNEVSSITGVSVGKIQKMADVLADPSKNIVAVYNMESRVDRSASDLKAMATLLMMLGKIGVEGSGLAIVSNQCNSTGMQLAGFDNTTLPGGVSATNLVAAKEIGTLWKCNLNGIIESSGTNLRRKIREDKIRAAFILGENPAIAPEFHTFVNNLEFLVVADMFMTETAQAADVFLPLPPYLETKGHLTNWCGTAQALNPIGEPMNGMSTVNLLLELAARAGHVVQYPSFESITHELARIIQNFGIHGRFNGKFLTNDGKPHFVPYSDQVAVTSAVAPKTLAIDARMEERSKTVSG
jgi:formate dehydrogenase major subunit